MGVTICTQASHPSPSVPRVASASAATVATMSYDNTSTTGARDDGAERALTRSAATTKYSPGISGSDVNISLAIATYGATILS